MTDGSGRSLVTQLIAVATVAGVLLPSVTDGDGRIRGASTAVVTDATVATTGPFPPTTDPTVDWKVVDPTDTTAEPPEPEPPEPEPPEPEPPEPEPPDALTWSTPTSMAIDVGTPFHQSLCDPEPQPESDCGSPGDGTLNPSGQPGPYYFYDFVSSYWLPPDVSLDSSSGVVEGTASTWYACEEDGSCGNDEGRVTPPGCEVPDGSCDYVWTVCVEAWDELAQTAVQSCADVIINLRGR